MVRLQTLVSQKLARVIPCNVRHLKNVYMLLIDVKTGPGIPYYSLNIVNSVSTYSIHYPLSLYRWRPNLLFLIKMLFRKYLTRGNTLTKLHEPGAFSQSLLLTVPKKQSLTFHSWNQPILVFHSYLLQSFSVSNHFILFS